ncbi:MAG: hypothetical protein ABSG19_14395 [Candidatus Aminicenantales bacterium]
MSESYYVVEVPGEFQIRHQSEEEAIDAAKEYLRKNPGEHKAQISEVATDHKTNVTIVYHTGGIFHLSKIKGIS